MNICNKTQETATDSTDCDSVTEDALLARGRRFRLLPASLLRLLGGGGESLLLGPLLVQLQQQGQHLVAERVRPAVAPRLLLRASPGFIPSSSSSSSSS